MKTLFFSFFLLTTTYFPQFENFQIIDLTHPFDENTIYWPTEEGFKLSVGFDGMTDKGYHYSANSFCSAEHGGTHLDAPIHFYAERMGVDEIPLNNLIGKAVVIDFSEQCFNNPDYQVRVEDILNWEKENGEIPERSIIILKSGYGKYWHDRNKYMGTDERGADAVAKLHFPGLHQETALFLINERKIKAVGIDTPSIDYGQSTHFEAHVVLAKHNIPIFENVANLDQVPDNNFILIALPMKIKGGSGAPTRIIALVER